MFLEIKPNVVINTNHIVSMTIGQGTINDSKDNIKVISILHISMIDNKTFSIPENGELFQNIFKCLEVVENRFLFNP